MDEQKKIARILQSIDRAIEKTEALIDKYQKIKAGLMQDLFTRGVDSDGRMRPPRDGHMAFVKTPDGISVELLQDGYLDPQEPWASMENTGSW